MEVPRRSQPLGVRAFVGVCGAGASLRDDLNTVCGRPTTRLRVGPASLAFIGRDNGALTFEKPVDAQILYTGRPFVDDRLLGNCLIDHHALPAPDKIDGKFAALVVKLDGVELLTDCIGAGTVFYAQVEGCLYFGSHLGLVAAALPSAPELNDLGVASQLAGIQAFDETHFRGIYRLEAGGRLSAIRNADQSIDVRQTHGDGIRGLLDIDVPPLTSASFRSMLDSGVAREGYDANSILMLSGGRDSLALALARAPTPTRCATFGEPKSIDVLRAKRRARRLGLEFSAVPFQDWTLETYLDEIVTLNAGCSGLQAAHNMVGFDWVADKANLASIGYLGDVFRDSLFGVLENGSDESAVIRVMALRLNDPILKDVFAKERETLSAFIRDTYRDLARDVGQHRALAMLRLKWHQARWISMSFDLCDWYLPISYPLVQRDLIAAWLQCDLNDPSDRNQFNLSLSEALAENGYHPNPRGSIPERVRNKCLAALARLSQGGQVIHTCDWQAIVERSEFRPEAYDCGHERLSDYTRRSWEALEAQGFRTNVKPAVYTSAAIAAACRQFSQSANQPALSQISAA